MCQGLATTFVCSIETLSELRTTVCHLKLFEPILACAFKSYDFTREDGDNGVDNGVDNKGRLTIDTFLNKAQREILHDTLVAVFGYYTVFFHILISAFVPLQPYIAKTRVVLLILSTVFILDGYADCHCTHPPKVGSA